MHLSVCLGYLVAHHLPVEHLIHLLEGSEEVFVERIARLLWLLLMRLDMCMLSTGEFIWHILVLSEVLGRLIDLGLASAI